MNWKRVKKIAIRLVQVTLVLAAALTGIAFMPVSAEGIYPGPRCMCDGIHIMRLKNNKFVMYSSSHPPAKLFGRYETKPDGTVDLYITPLRTDEPEVRMSSMKPRLYMKRPMTESIERMIREQEVTQLTIPNENELVTTYYDSSLNKIRAESRPRLKARKKTGDQAPDRASEPD